MCLLPPARGLGEDTRPTHLASGWSLANPSGQPKPQESGPRQDLLLPGGNRIEKEEVPTRSDFFPSPEREGIWRERRFLGSLEEEIRGAATARRFWFLNKGVHVPYFHVGLPFGP
jgi:hypothetical protein